MQKNYRLVLLALVCALQCMSVASAQECTHLWSHSLTTSPLTPKGISGDTMAAYAIFSFKADRSRRYVLKGQFPNARFMSLQTYTTKFLLGGESLLDFEVQPDSGSVNPFRGEGTMDSAHREFTVEVVPTRSSRDGENLLHFKTGPLIQAVVFRVYSPNGGQALSQSDLPRIFAYEANSERPASCPRTASVPFTVDFPQWMTYFFGEKRDFKLEEKKVASGGNKGIPNYMLAFNKMPTNDVAVVRLKAPSFVDTTSGTGSLPAGQVRYWSFCSQNIVKITTLGCVPDYLAKVDSNGYATFVFARSPEVLAEAERRGYSVIPDTRERDQKVAGFVYRNILPEESFAQSSMYRGEYQPRGVLCTPSEFLSRRCGDL